MRVQKNICRNAPQIMRASLWGISLFALWSVSGSSAFAQDVTKLESIKVTTTTKTAVDLRDAPASITVITAEDLEKRPVKDIMEAIRDTPSIQLEGRGVGGRKVMTVRGMESHQSLMMIDGKRISLSDNILGHSDFQFNWIPMDAVERIEIVRGPLSALYGSEALGGVINIITKAVPEEWGGSARAQYGFAGKEGGDEFNLGSYISGPISDKIGLMASVTYTDLSKRALKERPILSEQEGKKIFSFFGRLSASLAEGHRLDFDASIVNEERTRDTFSRGRRPVLHESFYDLDRRQYSVGYKGEFENFNVELKGYRSTLEQINRTTKDVKATNPQKLTDTVIDGHVTFALGEMNVITAGGEYRDEKLDHPVLAKGSTVITHKALFVQDELSFSEDFLVTAGLRYDDHEIFGSEISPRAFIVFHASDKLTFKGGYGHGFKAPTVKQISPEYKFIGFHSFFGNPDVKPESSNNFELSAAYDDEKLSAKITGFYNKIDDMITSRCITNCSLRFGRIFSFFNVDKAETKGLESEFKFQASDQFSFNFNHVYLKAKDTRTGLELANRPKHTVNASISYNNDQWGIASAIRLKHTGEQVIYDRSMNASNLPSYSLWNFTLSKVITENIKATFNVENIGNIRLFDKSDDFGFSERGRVFFIGLNAKF